MKLIVLHQKYLFISNSSFFQNEQQKIITFLIIKKKSMNRQQSQPVIHRHFHYHYYYDMNEPPYHKGQNYKQSQIQSPKNQKVGRRFDTWKNYINPDVTRRYEEISRTENIYYPKKPQSTIRKSNEYPTFFPSSINQSKFLSQSKLFQDRHEYEEYQREHSNENFDLPKTASFFMPQQLESQSNRHLEKHFQNHREKKTLDDFIRKQEDSKIFHSYESTTAKKENDENLRDSKYFFIKNSQPSFNIVTQSQIKSPKRNLNAENNRMGFSQIDPKQSYIKNLAQTNHSSRFQRLPTQESIKQESKNSQIRDFPLNSQCQLKSAKDTHYEFELIKEECEYLRSKFIEHIQEKHGIKF